MNVDNRKIRISHVDYLTRELITGRFVLTNNGIGIDIHGKLFDGQHRIKAIIEAGYPKELLLIVFGLPPNSSAAVDIGIKRTTTDIFKFAFDKPDISSQIVATARFYGLAKHGFQNKKPSPYEVYEYYNDIEQAIDIIFSVRGVSKLPAPVLAACCIRHKQDNDDEKIIEFLSKLLTGEGLEKNSPILRLRAFLERSRGGGTAASAAKDRFTRTATALVAYYEGRTLQKLYTRMAPMDLLVMNQKYGLAK